MLFKPLILHTVLWLSIFYRLGVLPVAQNLAIDRVTAFYIVLMAGLVGLTMFSKSYRDHHRVSLAFYRYSFFLAGFGAAAIGFYICGAIFIFCAIFKHYMSAPLSDESSVS